MTIDTGILLIKGLLALLAGLFVGGVLVVLALDWEIDEREDTR